ncbi:hypothetical protein G7046_g2473 [Stylonectria norvegica]|nr:hypothetical protein G7046_g2473 [Stylonectria norvegica]
MNINMAVHPLDPATPEELLQATTFVKQEYEGAALHFKAGGLEEPPKALLVEYLAAEHSNTALPEVPRLIYLTWYLKRTARLFEGIVDVTNGKFVRHEELPKEFHGSLDSAEMDEVSALILTDATVRKEIDRLDIDIEHVVPDPWDYGVDSGGTQGRKVQVYMYRRNPANNDPESNIYAFPLDFAVVVDLIEQKVTQILHIPLGADGTVHPDRKELTTESQNELEYNHRLQKTKPRETLKPYHVSQPGGASFTVEGWLVEWEKWRFRVGFNWREGLTIHDVHYDGQSVFYRLSLSEIFIPYGDPRSPINRKGAFDLGNVGAGVTANNLQLGCDCLGVIKYLDGHVISSDGTPSARPNAICIHEVDNGIQWKHTNFRTDNATVVRKRQLVLQTILTVANYEYILAWQFDQAGEITFEARATGILSTQPIETDPSIKVPWGTRVADGVMAPFHQHFFNLRIDPAVGGHKNSFTSTDSVPLPWDEEVNPLGIGYVTNETVLDRAGPVDDDISKGRVFKIINPDVENPVSRTPIGYKLVPLRSQLILAKPGSWHHRRSEFAEHAIWVTKHRDRQLFAAGDFTNQSLGGTGIKSWVQERDAVQNEDIVVWHTFGLTHNPRVEDFPVMPVEIAQVHLKPFNFFTHNPSIDVPPARQAFNQSRDSPPKKWILNAFTMNTPGHLAPGLWRHPRSRTAEHNDVEYWLDLAKTLEAGKFHGLFIADALGHYGVYKGAGNVDPSLPSAAQFPISDPLQTHWLTEGSLPVAIMSTVTKGLSFGVTASTTYENPFLLARRLASLDHLTKGRVAWNMVTGILETAAKNLGLETQIEHDERYRMADEFLTLEYKLWEGSWQDNAVVRDVEGKTYTVPGRVRQINHEGKYFKSAGPLTVDPSPQRTPFLFQAGASKAGKAFATKHAECMFLPGMDPAKVKATADDIRKQVAANGRDPAGIKFIAGMLIIVDETDEKAQAKYEEYLSYADLEGSLSLFSGWVDVDVSKWDDDDENFQFTGPGGIRSMVTSWSSTIPGTDNVKWTKRRIAQELAIGGAHPRAIGSATTVADILDRWITEATIDGFNVSYAVAPGDYEDINKWLLPELRSRGVFWDDYEGKTTRENYFGDGKGPRLRDDHPGSQYKWPADVKE